VNVSESQAAAPTASDGSDQLSWRRIAGFVGLFVGVFAIRVPFIRVPMINDEGAYAFWASIWTRDFEMYRDFHFARPQALIVVFKLILATLGGSLEAIRVAGALFAYLAACAIWLFAREFFSERVAWTSAGLYALFSAAPLIEGFTANAEIFTLGPLVFNAQLVWKRQFFWAGLVTAVAFQLKPSGVEGCCLIALFILASWHSLKDSVLDGLRSLTGFALGFVPMLLHGLAVGWGDFYYNMVTLRRQSYAPNVATLSSQLARVEYGTLSTLSSWIVPAILFALALFANPGKQRSFCVLWLLSAILGMEAGLWWDWHFFMQIVPPLCFAGGLGLLALRRARRRVAWASALALGLSLFLARDGRLWLEGPYEISWQIYGREPYLVSEQISDYIAKTTRPSDTIQVAFGQPEIYHLSGRRPAVINQLFNAHVIYYEDQWKLVVAAIEQRTPALIVWAQPPPRHRMSAKDFGRLVQQGYDFDRKFGQVIVYRRKPG
jgi:hypothetical protein